MSKLPVLKRFRNLDVDGWEKEMYPNDEETINMVESVYSKCEKCSSDRLNSIFYAGDWDTSLFNVTCRNCNYVKLVSIDIYDVKDAKYASLSDPYWGQESL